MEQKKWWRGNHAWSFVKSSASFIKTKLAWLSLNEKARPKVPRLWTPQLRMQERKRGVCNDAEKAASAAAPITNLSDVCMYVCMSRICTLSLSIFLFVSTRTCVCVYQVYVQSKKNSRPYEAAWISSVKWILSIQRIVRITILISPLISIPFNCALFLSYFYFFFLNLSSSFPFILFFSFSFQFRLRTTNSPYHDNSVGCCYKRGNSRKLARVDV